MSSPTDVRVTLEEVAPTPPPKPRRQSRPRITIPLLRVNSTITSPQHQLHPQRLSPIHSPVITIPMSPDGRIPVGMFQAYPSKAGEFMFKQFAGMRDFTMSTARSGLSVGEKVAFWLYGRVRSWSRRWFTHVFLLLVVLGYSVLGAMLFVATEGPAEMMRREQATQERKSLLQDLQELSKEGDWDTLAAERLRNFEDALSGLGPIPKDPQWSFWNAVFYCGTVYTTIGYGHISPSTTPGRSITIVYAIFGIPMFLILLADFGKLFTRGIKFVWSFVRRVYYTGSCKKMRRNAPVQEVMKGVQLVYDFATWRRPSHVAAPMEGVAEVVEPTAQTPLRQPPPLPPRTPQLSLDGLDNPPPDTPAPSAFEVDDEFNLPISVAIVILLLYIFVGATIYWSWERWGFFEAFYFVFISMSTIGFGDFVPQHPMYMMASIVYLVFGLALTSMCINVVQEKLSDSFRQASAKIGATIGLRMAEEDGSITSVPIPNVELPEVHNNLVKSQST